MKKVYQAEAYRSGAMWSFGDASYMLIRQYRFPDQFNEKKDKMVGWDLDRIMQQQHEHGRRCLKKHVDVEEGVLDRWVQRAEPEEVIAFLCDILEADPATKWSGFRVLGTVNRSNGHPVWTFQLFAKHPKSKTAVFDTENAPNLIHRSRHSRPT